MCLYTSPYADVCVSFLVLGESGMGKTTFIRQFLRSYMEGGAPVIHGEHDGSSTSVEKFERDPDSLRIQVLLVGPIPIPEEKLRLTVALEARGTSQV